MIDGSGQEVIVYLSANHVDDKQSLYRAVAKLHVANLETGFLASLGISFLSLMYQAIDESPSGVLIMARVPGQDVIGFVSGGGGMGAVYRRMLHHWWRLGVSLLPALVSPKKLWRIMEVFRYGRRESRSAAPTSIVQEAELFSIAVDGDHRGKGIAEALYRELERHFKANGKPVFKIVVGATLTTAHRFYQRMGASAVAQVEVHHGEISVVYAQTVG